MSNINILGKNGKYDAEKLTSNERAIEWFRCRTNIFYFIYNYGYLEEIGGKLKYEAPLMHYKMKRVIKSLYNFHFAVLMASRQLGKSSLAGMVLEWACNFYPGNRAMILNMEKNASLENLAKIKYAHIHLPSWMQIRLKYKGERKTFIEYEHNSIIKTFYPSSAIDPNTLGRSLTYPCMYIDEAAFIRHLDKAYASAQPALIRAQEQAEKNGYPFFTLVTSTPNGTVGTGEFFHSLWGNSTDSDELFIENEDVLEKNNQDIIDDETKNGYARIRYHWSEDDGKDEAWYIKQKRRFNFDTRKINQELDLLFVGGTNCIFEDEFLEKLVPKKPIYKIDIGMNSYLKFYKELNPLDYYLVGVDTAASMVGDFCAIEIFSFTNFEQVGEYFGRVGSLTKFKDMIRTATHHLYEKVNSRILLCIENNYANSIIEQLQEDPICAGLIYTPVDAPNHPNLRIKGKYKPRKDGINTNVSTKEQMISYFNDYIHEHPELINSNDMIDQLNIIERKGNGSVSAQSGHHDDLFMAGCFCAFVRRQTSMDILPLIGISDNKADNAYVKNIISTIKEQPINTNIFSSEEDDLNFNRDEDQAIDYLTII